jgi:hypothetical protein
MDPVRPHLEGQVGTIVQYERDTVIGTDAPGDVGSLDDPSRLEFLVPQLDDVDPAFNAAVEEFGEVGPVSGAEVEVPAGDRRS